MAFKNALFCLLLIITVSKQNPIVLNAAEEDVSDYRLQNKVTPKHYDLELTVPENFATTGKFSGTVKIEIKPIEETEASFSFHAENEYIPLAKEDVKLNRLGSNVDLVKTLGKKKDQEMYTVTPSEKLYPGNTYVLIITYQGKMSSEIMYGFYRSSYTDENGVTQWIATTQFQPTHARKAFPCFDEPEYKATFKIAITHPNAYHALSNAEILSVESVDDKTSKTTFEETPTMSTYLIAFIVSKYVGLKQKLHYLENTAWSPIETIDSTKYGLTTAPKILSEMEKVTGIPYTASGLKKLDQVSIPDFSAGAMENWGLVTYRETALHWNPDESSERNKQRVADVVAHELAHMWFGNLVTLKWWDSTWLNEGFARYFEYHATAAVETSWELDKQFVIEQLQGIMNSDSLSTSPPLTSSVNTQPEISAKFSSITYNKGASIIRMMEHFLGKEVFLKGLKRYIDTNKGKNTEPKDLWDAITAEIPEETTLPPSLPVIMENWINKGGFPVVSVTKDENNKIILKQKQFLFDEPTKPPTTKWHIPISYTTSKDKNFGDTLPKAWMADEESLSLPNVWKEDTKWIILNNKDTAYIRIKYEGDLLTRIQEALKSESFKEIDVLNRAQIVDDAMNLARADKLEYDKAFDTVFYLENEIDYYPWYPAFNAFAYLRRRFDSESEVAKLINRFISLLMEKYYEHATSEKEQESHIDIFSKVQALTWACQLDQEHCINSASEQFTQLKNGVSVDPNLRSVVYCSALQHSANAEEDWQFLWDKYKSTKVASEAATLLTALGCTSDEALLTEYLKKSITENSGIRHQDAQSVFTAVISGSPQGVTVGFKFLEENHASIVLKYGGMGALGNVISGLADRLTTKEQVDELEQFIKDNKGEFEGAIEEANNAIVNARANLAWAVKFEGTIQTYLLDKIGGDTGKGDGGGVSSVTASCVTVVLGVFLMYLYN